MEACQNFWLGFDIFDRLLWRRVFFMFLWKVRLCSDELSSFINFLCVAKMDIFPRSGITCIICEGVFD